MVEYERHLTLTLPDQLLEMLAQAKLRGESVEQRLAVQAPPQRFPLMTHSALLFGWPSPLSEPFYSSVTHYPDESVFKR